MNYRPSKDTLKTIREARRGRNDGPGTGGNAMTGFGGQQQVAHLVAEMPTPMPGLWRGRVTFLDSPTLELVDMGGDCYIWEGMGRSLEAGHLYLGLRYANRDGIATFMVTNQVAEEESSDSHSSGASSSTFSCPASSLSDPHPSSSASSGSTAGCCPASHPWCITMPAGLCLPSGLWELFPASEFTWNGFRDDTWTVVLYCDPLKPSSTYLSFYGPTSPEYFYVHYSHPGVFNCVSGGSFGRTSYGPNCPGCNYPGSITVVPCSSSSSSSSLSSSLSSLSSDESSSDESSSEESSSSSSSSSSSCGFLCVSVSGLTGGEPKLCNGNFCLQETSPGSGIYGGNNFPGGTPDACHDCGCQIDVTGSTATMTIANTSGTAGGSYSCDVWNCGGTFAKVGEFGAATWPDELTVGTVTDCTTCTNTSGCPSSSSSSSSAGSSSEEESSSSSGCPCSPGSWCLTVAGMGLGCAFYNGSFTFTLDGSCNFSGGSGIWSVGLTGTTLTVTLVGGAAIYETTSFSCTGDSAIPVVSHAGCSVAAATVSFVPGICGGTGDDSAGGPE